jgi:hypothetical protein
VKFRTNLELNYTMFCSTKTKDVIDWLFLLQEESKVVTQLQHTRMYQLISQCPQTHNYWTWTSVLDVPCCHLSVETTEDTNQQYKSSYMPNLGWLTRKFPRQNLGASSIPYTYNTLLQCHLRQHHSYTRWGTQHHNDALDCYEQQSKRPPPQRATQRAGDDFRVQLHDQHSTTFI